MQQWFCLSASYSLSLTPCSASHQYAALQRIWSILHLKAFVQEKKPVWLLMHPFHCDVMHLGIFSLVITFSYSKPMNFIWRHMCGLKNMMSLVSQQWCMINVTLPEVLKLSPGSLITCNDDRTLPYTAIFKDEVCNFCFTKANNDCFRIGFLTTRLPACHWSDKGSPAPNSPHWLSCCHAGQDEAE